MDSHSTRPYYSTLETKTHTRISEMADDLNLEILPPNQRHMDHWQPLIVTGTGSKDYRESSKHLRRRHRVEHPETYDEKDRWMLGEAIQRLNDALEKTWEGITTDCVFKTNPRIAIWDSTWGEPKAYCQCISKNDPLMVVLEETREEPKAYCISKNVSLEVLEATRGGAERDCKFKIGRVRTDLKVRVLAIVLVCTSCTSCSCVFDEVPPKLRYFSHVRDEDSIYKAICEPDQFDPSTSDQIAERPRDGNQQPDDQSALENSGPSHDLDIESLYHQTPGLSRNTHHVTVCHALIGTSILGVATSLSLALWWSFAHGDPGSGFTIGSYVLAVFGVLVGIPGYRHSKNCQCWESKPKGA